ncbi:MAG: hypothetical protein ACFFD4_07900 [Candidatus Odinarchaeota archaeon]
MATIEIGLTLEEARDLANDIAHCSKTSLLVQIYKELKEKIKAQEDYMKVWNIKEGFDKDFARDRPIAGMWDDNYPKWLEIHKDDIKHVVGCMIADANEEIEEFLKKFNAYDAQHILAEARAEERSLDL